MSLILSAATPASALTVHDASLNVTFTVPEGARAVPPPTPMRYAYAIDHPDGTRIGIGVSPMEGTIGREHIDPSGFAPQFPGGAQVTREVMRWGAFDLDVFRVQSLARSSHRSQARATG